MDGQNILYHVHTQPLSFFLSLCTMERSKCEKNNKVSQQQQKMKLDY